MANIKGKTASKKTSLKSETKKSTLKQNTKKKTVPNKRKKVKKTLRQKLKKYVYPSVIFALMMTVFNYVFMIISIYTDQTSGLYMWLFDNVILNVVVNTIFDFVFFFIVFISYTYMLIEMVILPEK